MEAILKTLEEYLPQIIATVILLILMPLSKYATGKLIRKYGTKSGKPEARMRHMKQLMSILITITFLLLLAIIWGVRPQNLLIGLSSVVAVLGVALFAQWSVLSNVTAGIIMFFSAPYRVGDRIRVIDKDIPLTATIENIGTFYTHIRTTEGELIVLSNSLFLQKIVGIEKDRE